MPSRKPPLCRSVAAAVLVAAAAHAAPTELLKVSPFLPPQGAAAAVTQNAPLEYRGSLQIGPVVEFRVVDPARKMGAWLKLGERDLNLGVVVQHHDLVHDTITVEHGGQTLTLPLHVAKVAAGGFGQRFASPAMYSPPMSSVSPAVINTVVPNPTPADEQRRLEAVAAEVARRRALREQAAAAAAARRNGEAPGPAPQPMVSRQDMQQLMNAAPPPANRRR